MVHWLNIFSITCSLNLYLKKTNLYFVPRGQFHSLGTNPIYSCILASYSMFLALSHVYMLLNILFDFLLLICLVTCSVSKSCLTLWTVALQASLSLGFFRQYWSRVAFPTPEDLPDQGMEPTSHESPALAGEFFSTVPPVSGQFNS